MLFIVMQEPHINTCYKHFYYFVNEFDLIDRKELEPLVSTVYLCIFVLWFFGFVYMLTIFEHRLQ